MLMNLGKNTNPKQISEWSEAISRLNEAYSMDKDYESYSNGIDKISSQIAKASGRSKNAINEMIISEPHTRDFSHELDKLQIVSMLGN